MGKRLHKRELLDAIDRERTALDATPALLSRRQMTQAGVTRGGWSVKDILAHLVGWQQINIRWYEAGVRGETPELPAPGLSWRELPRLNAMIYRKHRRRSLRSVLLDYRVSHQQVIVMMASLRDRDLIVPGRFSGTGPSWTLSDYLRANTVAHSLWARTRIRRWWKTQGSTGRKLSPVQPVRMA